MFARATGLAPRARLGLLLRRSGHSEAGGYNKHLDLPPTKGDGFSLFPKQSAAREHELHEIADATKTSGTWKKVSFFVAMPAVLAVTYHVLSHEEPFEDPKAIPRYPYLGLRIRSFPWGEESLFWNDHVNYVPGVNSEDHVKIPALTAFLMTWMRKDKDLAEMRRQRMEEITKVQQGWLELFKKENDYYTPSNAIQSKTAVFPRGQHNVF